MLKGLRIRVTTRAVDMITKKALLWKQSHSTRSTSFKTRSHPAQGELRKRKVIKATGRGRAEPPRSQKRKCV